MTGKIHARLVKLGIRIPKPTMPPGPYLPYVRCGDFLFLNGQLAERDGKFIPGRIGDTLTLEDGYEAARYCGLKILYQVGVACGGNLDRVCKIVKLTGFINSTPDFSDHPKVMNGASELMIQVFGDDIGRHARAAAGVSSLPFGAAVEIDAIVQIASP